MKRKLNEENVPAPVPTAPAPMNNVRAFDEFGLDYRLLQAVGRENFKTATPVQAKAIPLALEGQDILGTIIWTLYRMEIANSTSTGKDRVGQNSSLCPTHSRKHIAQEGRELHLRSSKGSLIRLSV